MNISNNLLCEINPGFTMFCAFSLGIIVFPTSIFDFGSVILTEVFVRRQTSNCDCNHNITQLGKISVIINLTVRIVLQTSFQVKSKKFVKISNRVWFLFVYFKLRVMFLNLDNNIMMNEIETELIFVRLARVFDAKLSPLTVV